MDGSKMAAAAAGGGALEQGGERGDQEDGWAVGFFSRVTYDSCRTIFFGVER